MPLNTHYFWFLLLPSTNLTYPSLPHKTSSRVANRLSVDMEGHDMASAMIGPYYYCDRDYERSDDIRTLHRLNNTFLCSQTSGKVEYIWYCVRHLPFLKEN